MNRLLLTCLVLLGLSHPALAWNDLGHMVVAKQAYEQLDGHKLQIARILKQHPHYEEFLAKNCPEGVSVEEWAFLRASIWPDWVRPRDKEMRGERVTRYNRPGDHYVNLPYVRPSDLELFKDLRVDPDRQDILGAFRQRVSELKLRETTDADKAVALSWLLHLIGDVHQPLHCATLYSPTFPEGDQGGNRFALKIGGVGYKLHAYWDNAVGTVLGGDDDLSERQARLYKAVKEATELLRAPEYRREKLPELADSPAFPGWVRESHRHAVAVAYQDGKLKGIPTGPKGSIPADAPEADPKYEEAVRNLAQRQVALAGHRLADKLKDIVRKD